MGYIKLRTYWIDFSGYKKTYPVLSKAQYILLLIPLEALNVDPRRITHWLDGTRAVPAGVWTDIKMLAEQRKAEIDELITKL